MTSDGTFSDQRPAEFDSKGIYYQEAHIHLLSCGTRVQHVNGLAVTSVASPSFSLLHGKQEAGRKCVLYGDSGFPARLGGTIGLFSEQCVIRFCFILQLFTHPLFRRVLLLYCMLWIKLTWLQSKVLFSKSNSWQKLGPPSQRCISTIQLEYWYNATSKSDLPKKPRG